MPYAIIFNARTPSSHHISRSTTERSFWPCSAPYRINLLPLTWRVSRPVIHAFATAMPAPAAEGAEDGAPSANRTLKARSGGPPDNRNIESISNI